MPPKFKCFHRNRSFGIVGADGETHQGVFDILILTSLAEYGAYDAER